ncbi:MAG: hypothetical protein ABF289_11955 [Clostridiales bacterium]
MKKNLKLKPIKDKLFVPKILNKEVPIECFYAHHGIIKLSEKKYSLCAVFKSEKSESNAYMSEVLDKYMLLLNNIKTPIQFYFSNQSLEKYNLYENINLQVNEDNERISYIILTSKAESVEEAAKILYDEMKRINEIFRIKVLSIDEYINVIYHFYNPIGEVKKGFFTELFLKGIYINDLFSSGDPEFEKSYLKIGDMYLRYFYTRELPENVEKNYITELFEQEFELSSSIHVDLLDKSKVELVLNEKLRKMKEEMKTDEFIPYEIEQNEFLSEKENNDLEKVFNVGMYIGTMATDLDILEKRSNIILSICKKYNSNAEVLTYQSEKSLASIMPIGNDKVNIRRILRTTDLIKLIYI